MGKWANIGVSIVALIHIGALIYEMFFWPTMAARIFENPTETFIDETRMLVANQGLYNGFLAAGLIWALVTPEPGRARSIANCFLWFVLVAGVFGAFTVMPTTIVVQTLPAAVVLWLVYREQKAA